MVRFGEFCPPIGDCRLPDGTIFDASVDMLEEGLLLNRVPSNGEFRFVTDPLIELDPEDNGLDVRLELVVLLLGVRFEGKLCSVECCGTLVKPFSDDTLLMMGDDAKEEGTAEEETAVKGNS